MRLVWTMPTTNTQSRLTFSVLGDFQFPKAPSMWVRRLKLVIQAGLPRYSRWRIFGVTVPGIGTASGVSCLHVTPRPGVHPVTPGTGSSIHP
jgi:hypothetical protein